MSHLSRLLGLSLGLILPLSLFAQTPPDAGTLQQQIERERDLQLPKRVAPEAPARPPEMRPAQGVTVMVSRFRFVGNTLLSDEALEAVVARYLNRPLDFNQLQAVAIEIANTYRDAGWVVRAYLPEQEIDAGEIVIQIVEAVFGRTHTESDGRRVDPDLVLRRVEAQQPQGELLNLEALDRGLLLANDLPGVSVTGGLRPGAAEGETDLSLTLDDEPLFAGDLSADNTGSRSTGRPRYTGNLRLASPFGVGEEFSFGLVHSQGSDYARMAASMPVGSRGLRIGVNGSALDYELISSEFSELDARGDSTVFGLEASYPIVRARTRNLVLLLNADRKSFDNEFIGETTTRYRIDSQSLGLVGNLFDSLGGGGANTASLVVTSGSRDNRVGTTNQQFAKLRYSVSRQQVITPELSLLAAFSGQYAHKDLDSSERFYLGGAHGVRAYPANEAGGSSASLANLELIQRLPHGIVASSFYDQGWVRNYDGSPSYSIKGAGLAVAWQSPFGINVKATWAHRIGGNPNPTLEGKDQDGSLIKNRWWLTASLPF